MFDVTPRDSLEQELSSMADSSGAKLEFERPFRGYAQYGVLTLLPEPRTP
jgi:S-adenosylmethionine-diacylgycerolhomoserine-N-methlytransferase